MNTYKIYMKNHSERISASSFEIRNGYLYLYGENEEKVAVYPPYFWNKIEKTSEES